MPHEEYKPYLEFSAELETLYDNSYEKWSIEPLALQRCDQIETEGFWPSIDDVDRAISD